MFCTEIVSDIQKTFCTQCVLPMFCKKKSFWQRFTCTDFIKKASVALKLITGFIVFAVVLTAGAVSKGALLFMVAQVKWNEILKIQSITCNVWLQLAEMRCVITSCDVLVEPMLVVTCNVRACGAFSGLRSTTAILHICGNNKRDFFWCTVFPQIVSVLEELWPKVIVHKAKLKKRIVSAETIGGNVVSYNFVALNWRILTIFHKKKIFVGKLLWRYCDLKQCLKAKILD